MGAYLVTNNTYNAQYSAYFNSAKYLMVLTIWEV